MLGISSAGLHWALVDSFDTYLFLFPRSSSSGVCTFYFDAFFAWSFYKFYMFSCNSSSSTFVGNMLDILSILNIKENIQNKYNLF